MAINVGGNLLSSTGFNTSSEILNTPNVVTDGLVLWLDVGNLACYNNTNNYYDCGYGCQYYASDPGCTNCNTQLKDMSGLGNDWSIVGTYTPSNVGGYVQYSSQVTSRSASSDWLMTTDCTIDLWYYPPSGGIYNSCCATIFGRYWFRFFQIGNSFYTMIGFDNGGSSTYQHPSYAVSYDNWHHIVGMRRNNNFIIWLDGTELYNTNWGTGMNLWSPNETWYISDASHSSIRIAGAKIYNRGISDTEILQNFNSGRQRFGI